MTAMPGQPIHTITSIPRLVPVVEFQTHTYRKREREYPTGLPNENPDGWHRHWSDSLSDSGIGNLEPIRPGSNLVPVNRLVEHHVLMTLLAAHAAESQDEEEPLPPREWLETLETFSGGFVLCEAERELVFPGCCCCLASLGDWRTAAATESPAWEMLWIGHPHAYVRREGETLQIRQEDQGGPEFVIDPDALRSAVAKAGGELRAFSDFLLPVASEWIASLGLALTDSDAGELARRLAGVGADHC